MCVWLNVYWSCSSSRLRMQQREKEISNSKKNLKQLFTQLDQSASGMSLNMSTDVEDVRDSKIASLESSLAALKSEKRDLELKLLSLETVQGTLSQLFTVLQLTKSHLEFILQKQKNALKLRSVIWDQVKNTSWQRIKCYNQGQSNIMH